MNSYNEEESTFVGQQAGFYYSWYSAPAANRCLRSVIRDRLLYTTNYFTVHRVSSTTRETNKLSVNALM